MTFELTLTIDAPPEEVFEFVADFTTMPQWYSAVQRVDRLGENTGIGTRYEVHRNLPGGPARNEVAITDLTPERAVTFTSLSGPTPFVYRYEIESEQGKTQLTLEGTISAAGLPGPAALLGTLAEKLFKRGMRDNLGTLAEILRK